MKSEGLRTARLLMVLSSISPLFILWAIRGSPLVSDWWLLITCAALVILPNAFLWLRLRTARRLNEVRSLKIGVAEDHRDHILVYLFAMLLPFYSEEIGSWRYLGSTIAALAFIVFLFWHLNLHYMNLIFAARGFRIFTVYPPDDGNPVSGKSSIVLITRRVSVQPGQRVSAYRLSDTVYMEADA